jgi:hypothetical protein
MEKQIETTDFYKQKTLGEIGVEAVTQFLMNLKFTVSVKNVELDEEYQVKDIDLIWTYTKNGTNHVKTIEVKSDTFCTTGNFAFEIWSNLEQKKKGCFMITQSDWFFYFFPETRELHILPTNETRDWYMRNTATKGWGYTYPTTNNLYTTKCRLVPIKEVQNEINYKVYKI